MESLKLKYVNEQILQRVTQEVRRERMKLKEDKQWLEYCGYQKKEDNSKEQQHQNFDKKYETMMRVNSSVSHVIPDASFHTAIDSDTLEILRKSFQSKLLPKLASMLEISTKTDQPVKSVEVQTHQDVGVQNFIAENAQSNTAHANLESSLWITEQAAVKTLSTVAAPENATEIAKMGISRIQRTSDDIVRLGTADIADSTLKCMKSRKNSLLGLKAEPALENVSRQQVTEQIVRGPILDVEAVEFVNKVKQFRTNINLTLDKIMLKIDENPMFDELRQWEQMRNRVSEFEVRFSRNHIYQIQRLFDKPKNGLSSSLDLSRRIRTQMKRILLLYQTVHKAIQSFYRSMNVIWMGRYNHMWQRTLKGQPDSSKIVLLSLLNFISNINITCNLFHFPDAIQLALKACTDDGLVLKSQQLTNYLENIPKFGKLSKNKSAWESNRLSIKTPIQNYGYRNHKCPKSVYESKPLSSCSTILSQKRSAVSSNSIPVRDERQVTSKRPIRTQNLTYREIADNDVHCDEQKYVTEDTPIKDDNRSKDVSRTNSRNAIYTIKYMEDDQKVTSSDLSKKLGYAQAQKFLTVHNSGTSIDKKGPSKLSMLDQREAKSQMHSVKQYNSTVNFGKETENDTSSLSSIEDYNLGLIYEMIITAAESGTLSESCLQLLPIIAKTLRTRRKAKARAQRANTSGQLAGGGARQPFIEFGGGRRAGKTPETLAPREGRRGVGDAASKRSPTRKSASATDINKQKPGSVGSRKDLHKVPGKAIKPSSPVDLATTKLKKFSLDQEILDKILNARMQHVKDISGNDMYKIKDHNRPWEMIEKISDLVLDEIIVQVCKEIMDTQESLVPGLLAVGV